MTTGKLIEIFSSLQGEGTLVGTPMTFVRFEQCSFGCHYCDTPESFKKHSTFRVETPPRSTQFQILPNPVSVATLNEVLASFDDPYLAVTGGEPLEQGEFLTSWLPTVKHRKVLLETNGVHPEALQKIISFIDVVSMDVKPPTSTGTKKSYWQEHAAFLDVADEAQKEIYVKLIVTENLSDEDVKNCISLLLEKRRTPLILQPVSKTMTFQKTVSPEHLYAIEQMCRAKLEDVRVLPQMHKIWGVL